MDLVEKIVNFIILQSNNDCEGCLYSYLSQKHHTCLIDCWSTTVFKYFNQAINTQRIVYTSVLFNKVLLWWNYGSSDDQIL